MIYILIGVVALASFAVGIFVAYRLLKKEYAGNVVSGEREVVEQGGDLHEEETRKVELVDFEDLLDVDGDVIEAEPAPMVPEERYLRAQNEISALKDKVRDLEVREQSQQFEIHKLKKSAEENRISSES